VTERRKAYLVLADGNVFEGAAFGASLPAYGEVVFNTSMTGYQEMLTNPSYAGQILVPTYPMQGNYGIAGDVESGRIQVRGFVVGEECAAPSHGRSEQTLREYLAASCIPGLAGVDTRALTRHLRTAGVMMGAIASDAGPEEALARLRSQPDYGALDFVREVSTRRPYEWEPVAGASDGRHIVVLDMGVKFNILRLLKAQGCRVTVVPPTMAAEDILALGPDGVVLSPGPGDPARLDYIVRTVKGLIGARPVFGICLGHQLVARAFGADTFKLKFGHRGGNHPVKDLATERVYITAQNHGYAVDPARLPQELEVSHINLNDGTVEGLRHRSLPLVTVQYHGEASPGPRDNEYLFGEFMGMIQEALR
jgi:carbamoyl-phosphate synthase small subunit